MASIDEVYLDMTGTERLHGPPLQAAHKLHNAVGAATNLNCSIGIATSRMASPPPRSRFASTEFCGSSLSRKLTFSHRSTSARFPASAKSPSRTSPSCGIKKVGDLAAFDPSFVEQRFGQWGLALAARRATRRRRLVRWRDWRWQHSEIRQPCWLTFSIDTKDRDALDAMLASYPEKVARRCAITTSGRGRQQIKLRYTDFSTFTRSGTLDHATQIDSELAEASRSLLHKACTKQPIFA